MAEQAPNEPASDAEHHIHWRQLLRDAATQAGSMFGIYDQFHRYSYTNQLLFREQGYNEPMASRATWKKLGRYIRRGSRAGLVIVPLLVNEPESEPTEPCEEDELDAKRERVARLVGFTLVRGVFPVSATGGKELPPVPTPGWDYQTALGNLGVREVPFNHTDGNVQGWSRGLELAINPLAVNRNKTVFHELGHIVLGHTLPSLHERYAQHRGLMEGEADGTALLSMKEVGLLDDETASHIRAYFQHWMDGEQLPEKSIRRIFNAVGAILRAGRVAQDVAQDVAQEGAASL